MWVDAVLAWFFTGVETAVGALPTCAAIGFDVSGLTELSPYLAGIGLFVDLTTLVMVLTVLTLTEVALQGWRVGVWVYEHIPFVG